MVREFDERNMARSRERCAAMAEAANTGKRILTERERQILEMWPRFEDGELVMVGDRVGHPVEKVGSITILESAFVLCDDAASSAQYERGQCVKRPVQSVLDADGVEIKVGDTVYGVGRSQHSFDVIDPHHIDPEVGEAFSVRCYDRDEHEECHCKPKLLTHTRPDSWERLEEDAESIRQTIARNFGDFSPSDFKQSGDSLQDRVSDIVRRAKALAGVEQ